MGIIKTTAPSPSKTKPVRVVYGSDEAAVKKHAAALAAELAPSDPLNFETIDARADNTEDALGKIDALRAAILTVPFFGGEKLVWWKNLNFLDESPMGKSAQIKDALAEILPVIETAQGVVLLISALTFHKTKAFAKGILKFAAASVFDLPEIRQGNEDQVIDQLEKRLREAGLTPGPGAAERLFRAVGVDSTAWRQEIEKLVCYRGAAAGPLTAEEVHAIVGGSREVLIWDFCDAVLSGQPRVAMEQLNLLLAQGESEVGILIVLAGRIRQAALAAVLREHNLLKLTFSSVEISPRGMDLLPRKKTGEPISTFALGQIAHKTRQRSSRDWIDALETLYQANLRMTGGSGDKVRTLEAAVISICLRTAGR